MCGHAGATSQAGMGIPKNWEMGGNHEENVTYSKGYLEPRQLAELAARQGGQRGAGERVAVRQGQGLQ